MEELKAFVIDKKFVVGLVAGFVLGALHHYFALSILQVGYELTILDKNHTQIASPISVFKIVPLMIAYDLSCRHLKSLVGEICASDEVYYILQISVLLRGYNGECENKKS